MNISDYRKSSVKYLSKLAKQGDEVAFDFLQVATFNKEISPGDVVLFLKSEIEGKVRVKTAGKAKLLSGESHPVVPLEVIGDVLLSKIEGNVFSMGSEDLEAIKTGYRHGKKAAIASIPIVIILLLWAAFKII